MALTSTYSPPDPVMPRRPRRPQPLDLTSYLVDTDLTDSEKALQSLSNKSTGLYAGLYNAQIKPVKAQIGRLLGDTGARAATRTLFQGGLLAPAFLIRQLQRRQAFASPEALRAARRGQVLNAAKGATAAGLASQLASREAGLNVLNVLGGLAPSAAQTGLAALSAADTLRQNRMTKYNDIMAAREQGAAAKTNSILTSGAQLAALYALL